jgi:hypothetical protein
MSGCPTRTAPGPAACMDRKQDFDISNTAPAATARILRREQSVLRVGHRHDPGL